MKILKKKNKSQMNSQKHTHSRQIETHYAHRWSWPVTLRPCHVEVAGFPHWMVFIGVIRTIRIVSIIQIFMLIILHIFITVNEHSTFQTRVLHLSSIFTSLSVIFPTKINQFITKKLNNPESQNTKQTKPRP